MTPPDRAGPVYAALEEALRVHACIRIHTGKTKVWNRADVRPDVCDVLERIAQATDPTASVWKGSTLPTHKQGIKVLGTPLGHPDFVRDQLRQVTDEHQTLLRRIPAVRDVQCSWFAVVALRISPSLLPSQSSQAISCSRVRRQARPRLVAVLVNCAPERPESVPSTGSVSAQLCLLPLEVWA